MAEEEVVKRKVGRPKGSKNLPKVARDGEEREGSYRTVQPEEKVMMVEMREAGLTTADIARKVGRSRLVVERVIRRYSPTVKLAERFLQARAVDLAERVFSKANVEQALDVLSRPNIGVLQPVQNKGFGSAVMVSVNQRDLGAIEVGVAQHAIPAAGRISDGAEGSEQGGGEQSQREQEAEAQRSPEQREARHQELLEIQQRALQARKGSAAIGRDGSQQSGGDVKGEGGELHLTAINKDQLSPQNYQTPGDRGLIPQESPFHKSRLRTVLRSKHARGSKPEDNSNVHLRYDLIEPDPKRWSEQKEEDK